MIPIGIIELAVFVSSMIALFIVPNAFADNVVMNIEPKPTYCKVNTYCNVASVNTTTIENISDEVRTYHIVYTIYSNDRYPAKLEFNVPIAAHSKWSEPRTVNLSKRFGSTGKFLINYYSTVTSKEVNKQIQVDKYVEVNN